MYHDMTMSIRTLRRKLKDYGLSRKHHPADLMAVWNAVRAELQGSST